MNLQVFIGIMIPLIGTTLGTGIVFFIKEEMSAKLRKILTVFAGGGIIAASFWSLLEPSLEESSHLGKLSFIPAAAGFLVGRCRTNSGCCHNRRHSHFRSRSPLFSRICRRRYDLCCH